MQHEQYRQVIAVCERHGEQEPSLWEQALSYFARKEEDCKEYVAAVLKHIESKNLMPPLLGTGKTGRVGGGCRLWDRALELSPEGSRFMVLFPPGSQFQWCRPWPTIPQPPCLSFGTTWSKSCRNRASKSPRMSSGCGATERRPPASARRSRS